MEIQGIGRPNRSRQKSTGGWGSMASDRLNRSHCGEVEKVGAEVSLVAYLDGLGLLHRSGNLSYAASPSALLWGWG